MESIKYMTSLLTFYLKGEIKIGDSFVKIKIPNTVLGILPLGSHNKDIAINQIVSVETDFRMKIGRVLIGALLALSGLLSLPGEDPMISLIILAIGIASVINAIQAHLVIKTASGEILDILFLIFEKNKAENTAECLKRRISERFTDTDVHYHTQEQTERLVSAIHSLKN